MKSILRLRRLAIQDTWCRRAPSPSCPLSSTSPFRTAATALKAASSAAPYAQSGGERAVPASLLSRKRREVALDLAQSDSAPSTAHTSSSSASSSSASTSSASSSQNASATSSLSDPLLLPVVTLLSVPPPSRARDHPTQLFHAYTSLPPSLRLSLPPSFLLALLRQIVPPRRKYALAPADLNSAKVWEVDRARLRVQERLRVLVADLQAARWAHGQDEGGRKRERIEWEYAMRRLMEWGEVDGVQAVRKEMLNRMPSLAALDPSSSSSSSSSSDPTVDEATYHHLLLRAIHSRLRSFVYWSNLADTSPNPRRKPWTAATEQEVVSSLWRILDVLFKHPRAFSREKDLGVLVHTLNLARACFREEAFAEGLDSMMRQIVERGYGVDLKWLSVALPARNGSKESVVPLSVEGVNAVLEMLGRDQGQGWRVVGAYEMLAERTWAKRRGPGLGQEEEGSFGQEAVAVSERGGGSSEDPISSSSAQSHAPNPSIDFTSSRPDDPSPQARTFADFLPPLPPSPLDIASAVPDPAQPNPYYYPRPLASNLTFDLLVRPALASQDPTLAMHVLRLNYLESVKQQAMFVSKMLREAARRSQSQSPSTNDLRVDRRVEPRVHFSRRAFQGVRWMLRKAKAAGGGGTATQAAFGEVERMLEDATRRIREEHLVLSGREPLEAAEVEALGSPRVHNQEGEDTVPPFGGYPSVAQPVAAEAVRGDYLDPARYLFEISQTRVKLLDELAQLRRQRERERVYRRRRNVQRRQRVRVRRLADRGEEGEGGGEGEGEGEWADWTGEGKGEGEGKGRP